MKQNMIFAMALVLLLGMMVGCGGYSSSKEISDLRDSIAVLKAQLQELKGAGTRPATSIEGADTHIDKQGLSPIPGVYTFTDKAEDEWTLTMNEDNSGQLQKGAYTAYFSWKDLRDIDRGIKISFGADHPTIWFDRGDKSIFTTYIVDGYFYASNVIADTKDPNLRLALTKVE